MPDLLFDPSAAPPAARAHLLGCQTCRGELLALQNTMGLLDNWKAPEPSPYWAARMGARLREEQAAPSRWWAGLLGAGLPGLGDRLRNRLSFGNRSLRPAVGAAALVLAIGGGAWFNLAQSHGGVPAAQASNTVRDLQSLNENAVVFQQLSALDEPDSTAQAN